MGKRMILGNKKDKPILIIVSLEGRYGMGHLAEKLKAIRVFSELSPPEVTQLAGYFQPFSYDAGEYIISQATSHRGLHLILSGSVEVRLKIFGGGELSIAKLKAGDVFGEISLISDYPATASVIAEDAVSGLLFTPVSMETVSVIYPPLSDKIKNAIALHCCERSRKLLQHLPHKANHQHIWPNIPVVKESLNPEVNTLNVNSLNDFLKRSGAESSPIPFFNQLSQDEVDILNEWVKLRIVYRGDSVDEFSKQEHGFYGLLWGAVQALMLGDRMVKVTTYGPGDLFGTMEYVDKLMHPYRYVTREDAIYFSLSEKGMADIKNKSPILWGKIMQQLFISIGAQMNNINWIFLQLNVEDVYQVSQGESHV